MAKPVEINHQRSPRKTTPGRRIGIKPITLSRWTNNDSDPRPQNLRHLLTALPQQREQMLELIREEHGFEEFSNAGIDDSALDIPSAFYNRVFAARASIV